MTMNTTIIRSGCELSSAGGSRGGLSPGVGNQCVHVPGSAEAKGRHYAIGSAGRRAELESARQTLQTAVLAMASRSRAHQPQIVVQVVDRIQPRPRISLQRSRWRRYARL